MSSTWYGIDEDQLTLDPRTGSALNGSDGKVSPWVKGLGLFSIGLGLAETIAPGSLARMAGVRTNGITEPLTRMAGMREIAAGLGILVSRQPTNWLRGRVGGDLMDLTMLGMAFRSDTNETNRLAGATAAVAGVTVLDLLAARHVSQSGAVDRPEVRAAITIQRPAEEVYAYWRDFSRLPNFMRHLESIESTGENRWHWVARAPLRRSIEWDAEVVADVPNEVIAWKSLPGSNIDNAGSVHFRQAPGDRGTEVHVTLRYAMPGGRLTSAFAKLFPENPDREVYDDLRAFKQELETGEVVKSDAVLSGGRLRQRPGQPPSPSEMGG